MKSFDCGFVVLTILLNFHALASGVEGERPAPDGDTSRGASNYLPTILEVRHLAGISTLGDEYNARLSSDGNRIYYLSDQTGKVRLYVADRVNGSIDFENPRLFEFASGQQPDDLLSFELAEADVAMLVVVEGPDGSDVPLMSRKVTGVFEDPRRIAVRMEDGGYLAQAFFSDIQANGDRLVSSGTNGHKHPTWLQDPTQEGRFLYNPPTVHDDELERLCSADFGGRVWLGYHGGPYPYGVHAAWGFPRGTSVYQLYSDPEVSANFYWQEFKDEFPLFATAEELSQDGTLLVVSGTRGDTIGETDLYTLHLQAPLAVRQAAIADYIVTAPTNVDPLEFDENESFDVDAADVQSVTQP